MARTLPFTSALLVCNIACVLAAGAQPPPQPDPSPPPPPPPAPAPTSTATSEPPNQTPMGLPVRTATPDVPTDVPEEIEEGKAPQPNWFGITKDEDPFKDIQDALDALNKEIGLKLGGAYTMLFQQASGGPGQRSAAGGDIDFLGTWQLIERGTPNVGELNFSFEYRFQIGDMAPSALGPAIGTLIPTTNSFSERPLIVKELYWNQRLLDGALRLVVGRIDMENYVGAQRMQSANTFFLNKAFSSNPAIAYPAIGLGAGGGIQPCEWLILTGGVVDANAQTTGAGFDTAFNSGELFAFAEIGVLTDITDLGKGRQRLAFWHMDERKESGKPSDQGLSLTLDQDFGEIVTAFIRVAYSDADLTNVRWLVEGGVGLKGLIGSDGDFSGLGIAYAAPPNGRAETIVEVFHRFQLALRTQFTLGYQVIFNPSNAPGDDALGVFSARFRLTF